MFYLFNQTYLKVDKLYKSSRKRITISKEYGNFKGFIEPTSMHKISGFESTKPLSSASSYQELIDKEYNGSETMFVNALLNHGSDRLTIYCDSDAMITLLAKFFKTLYPYWTSTEFVRVMRFYLLYITEQLTSGSVLFTALSNAELVDVKFQYSAITKNEELLVESWNSNTAWPYVPGLRERITKTCSMELQLATVLSNPEWIYASVIKNKVTRMFRKEMIREFIANDKFAILNALVNFSVIEPTTKFNIEHHTIRDLVDMHPEYRFLTDIRFIPDNIDYIFATYDINQLRDIHNKAQAGRPPYEIDWDWLISPTLSFDDMLTFETARPLNRLFMRYGDYEEQTCSYLIDAILDAYRSGDMSAMKYLEIR